MFGGAPQERRSYSRGQYQEETKARPAKQTYNQYDNKVDDQGYQQYNKPSYQNLAPRSSSRGGGVGVQLPIATKDYGAFKGGAAYNEGAGIGKGYSQPMQPPVPTKQFEGGAGTKFY